MSESRHFDTIVIGAGISGLACAARLVQQQARSKIKRKILVLEARDRIGGRVGAVYLNGSRLDTGANWIHGIGTEEKPNPLMKVLPHKRYRQLSGSVVFRPPTIRDGDQTNTDQSAIEDWEQVESSGKSSEVQSHGSKGDLVLPPETAGALMGTMWGLFDVLHETSTNTPASEAKNTTMLSSIAKSEIFQEALEELPSEHHQALRALPQFVESMEAAPLVAQSAESAEDHPGMGLLEYAIDDFDGDQVFLQDGYTAVVEELAKDLVTGGNIELGVEVEEISWENNAIKITSASGSVYTAANVVCSLPLGVLKAGQEALFQPSLPTVKQNAITSLGFGTLDKIFLVYSAPWWTKEPYSAIFKKGFFRRPTVDSGHGNPDAGEDANEADGFLGFTSSLPGIEVHPDGTASSSIRALSITNLHSLCGFPVLCCFISCSNAQQIEALPDSHAESLVHDSLTTWLGMEPPKPDAVHVTRWSQDKYSRGSYSHMITGVSETQHREEFQKPIVNADGFALRFAGEHTSRDHFATVHGALLSGWREADAILEESEKGEH